MCFANVVEFRADAGCCQNRTQCVCVVLEGEIIDSTFMSKKALVAFFEEQIADAKAKGILFSLHMKETFTPSCPINILKWLMYLLLPISRTQIPFGIM